MNQLLALSKPSNLVRIILFIGSSIPFGKFTLKRFLLISFALIIGLVVIFIFQVNAEVSGRYTIQKYNGQLSEIAGESQSLEMGFIESNTLNKTAVLTDELNFVKTDKVHYIKVLNSQVVKK